MERVLRNSQTPIASIFLIAADDGPLGVLSAVSAARVSLVRERDMPFSRNDIEGSLQAQGATAKQASWYYQQLLKFYVFEVIRGLGKHVLILDADFVLSRPLHFLTEDGRAILSRGYPFKWLLNTCDYPARVDHVHADFARRLVAGWEPVGPFSGMHHHMVFERDILAELFEVVEREHGRPFWRAFTLNVRLEKWNAASEYVIYYHFALARHPRRIELRDLKTCDIIHDSEQSGDAIDQLAWRLDSGEFDAVGCHGFLDLRSRIATMDYIPNDLRTELMESSCATFLLLLDGAVLRVQVDARQPYRVSGDSGFVAARAKTKRDPVGGVSPPP